MRRSSSLETCLFCVTLFFLRVKGKGEDRRAFHALFSCSELGK